MEDINNENDYNLTRRENKKNSAFLDAENANWIVESKLDNVLNNNNVVMDDNNDGGVSGDNPFNAAEEWNGITTLVKDEGAGMAKAEEKKAVEAKSMKSMEAIIHQLRNKLVASQQGVSFLLFVGCVLCLIHICTHRNISILCSSTAFR